MRDGASTRVAANLGSLARTDESQMALEDLWI
jgi:hypothetical protein